MTTWPRLRSGSAGSSAENVPTRTAAEQSPQPRGIQRGDIVAVAVILVASVLFVALFAMVPILGAPD